MLEVASLAELVTRERRAAQETTVKAELLSDAALIALGHVIGGLEVVEHSGDMVQMRCLQNYSRLRPGDRVRLSCGDTHLSAIIADVRGAGLSIAFQARRLPPQIGSGPWAATEESADLSASVLSALNKLQPGAPGWAFFKLLSGQKRLDQLAITPNDTSHEALYSALAQESRRDLDTSQRDAFLRCLAAPPALAVQGPPGTGKTRVLAFVAEGMARSGKRVAIVAPTHQAVNNALSTLHELFPSRKLLKIGDPLRRASLADDIPTADRVRRQDERDAGLIVGLTYMSAIHRLMLSTSGFAPNALIIDEAGQLPLAQGAVAGLCGAGSVLLFGDDMQMPPVFESDVSENPLATSVFARFRMEQPAATQMLHTTYRLNQELCDAIGTTFYAVDAGNPLTSSHAAGSRRLNPDCAEIAPAAVRDALVPERSFVWLQVPGSSSAQYNAREAALAASIVATCINAGLPVHQIAVVTPFRRQAVRIHSLLSEQLPHMRSLPIIDTVERVQGLTVEVVVVSLCASEPAYLASVAGFLFDPRRMNVAVSRARTKAVVLSAPHVFGVVASDFGAMAGRDTCRRLLELASPLPITTS